MKQLKNLQANKSLDENFILKKCNELLKEASITKAPIEPQILASFRDIRIVESQMAEAGILYPLKEGGAEIQLRKTDSTERKRFTCCHEITHTFCPDWQLNPQKRIDKETGVYKKNNWIEYLCDFGASELLMPSFLFYPRLSKLGFSLTVLQQLSGEFGASLEATAIKMVKQDSQKRGVVIWEKKHKPSEYLQVHSTTLPGFEDCKPQERLRIKFGCGLKQFGHIPPHKSLEESNGIIQTTLIRKQMQKGREEINFGNFKVNCEVQTMFLKYCDKTRILSLLYVK